MREISAADVRAAMIPREKTSHKNTFGHLLIIAGSVGMAGAAAIAARAAVRSGAGLVTVACPEAIVPIIQVLEPCAMCAPLQTVNGALSSEGLEKIIMGKTALAIGCGLSLRADPEAVRLALSCGLKAAVDADALNIIAKNADLKKLLGENHVITPHPGEAARLLGRTATACAADAIALRAETGATALLKGADSFIAGRETYVSRSGSVGMAKGGSGDALTGVLGAFLAQGYEVETAAWLASEIHGLAGEIAAQRRGIIAMTPMDTVDALSEAFMAYAE